jgi:hypothetical protein
MTHNNHDHDLDHDLDHDEVFIFLYYMMFLLSYYYIIRLLDLYNTILQY